LRADFALHQLETDMGGTAPVATQFLPFPLKPGPFEAGYAGGPAADGGWRTTGAHELLTAAGSLGRLWDPQRSHLENTRLEYTRNAPGIFQKCGLPVPPECEEEKWVEKELERPDLRRSTKKFFDTLGLSRMLTRITDISCRNVARSSSDPALDDLNEAPTFRTDTAARSKCFLATSQFPHRRKTRATPLGEPT